MADQILDSSEQQHKIAVVGNDKEGSMSSSPDQPSSPLAKLQQVLRKRIFWVVVLALAILGSGLVMGLVVLSAQPESTAKAQTTDVDLHSVTPNPLSQVIKKTVANVLPLAKLSALRDWWPGLVAGLIAVMSVVASVCVICFVLLPRLEMSDIEAPGDVAPAFPSGSDKPMDEGSNQSDDDESRNTWIIAVAVASGVVSVVACVVLLSWRLKSGRCDSWNCFSTTQPPNQEPVPNLKANLNEQIKAVERPPSNEANDLKQSELENQSLDELVKQYIKLINADTTVNIGQNPKKFTYNDSVAEDLKISGEVEDQSILNACILINKQKLHNADNPFILMPSDRTTLENVYSSAGVTDFCYYLIDLTTALSEPAIKQWLVCILMHDKLDPRVIHDLEITDRAKDFGSFMASKVESVADATGNFFSNLW